MRYFLLLTLPLAAHDMWIEPASYRPNPGDIVSVRLKVGQDFIGDPLPRSSALVNQFIVSDREGRKPLVGRDGSDPAGYFRAEAGAQVLGYYSNPSQVEETAEKFNNYLREEGLDKIAPSRGPVKELFTRCAKSLVGTTDDQTLGFPLELLAERVEAGELRLTYQGKPIAGVLVIAMNRQNPMEKISARTDAAGRVRLKIATSGTWLVKAVHMIPAPAASGADWQSFWASLTFQVTGKS